MSPPCLSLSVIPIGTGAKVRVSGVRLQTETLPGMISDEIEQLRANERNEAATLLRERRNPRRSQPIDRPVYDPRDVCFAVAERERREGENRRDCPMHRGP